MAAAVMDERHSNTPAELRGWHWGAFGLSWIWAFAHRQWLWGILGLIPLVSLVAAVYLGIKGKQIAWQERHGRTVEEVVRSERKWTVAWLVVLALTVMLIGLLIVTGAMSGDGSAG